MGRLLSFLFVVVFFTAYAQSTVTGIVINATTKEVLPFVNIRVLGTTVGTTSNVEGHFQISIQSRDTLVFSYVGFSKLRLGGNSFNTKNLVVELREKTTELNEVVVRPGENPAWKIIRRALDNRSKNDPENLSTFQYNCYNKLFGTMMDDKTNPEFPNMDTAKAKKFLTIIICSFLRATQSGIIKDPINPRRLYWAIK